LGTNRNLLPQNADDSAGMSKVTVPQLEIPEITNAEDMLVIRKWQMWRYILAMSWGTILVGWGILGNASCAPILIAQFGWDEEETKLYNSILSTVGLFGIMMGSIFGGQIITYGRRKAIFIMFFVMLVGVGLTLIQTFPTMVIGRFTTGAASSVYQMSNIKAVQETVPSKWRGVYGTTAGALISVGVFFITVIGAITLPTDKD